MNKTQTRELDGINAELRNDNRPEWLRIPEAVRRFGICRSSLYALIAEHKIKSTCLKKRGAVRGIRIISYDSLAAFCEQSANDEEAR